MQQPVDEGLTVPTDSVLAAVANQRNTAFDALARAEVFIEQLMQERNQFAAEVERLRDVPEPGV